MHSSFQIIQGGMGTGVSGWLLANAVSSAGQLGVVSGTVMDTLFARRLQLGDPGGHSLRALMSFPDQDIVERILKKFYIPGGKAPDAPYKRIPVYSMKPSPALVELTVVANFVEVFLAREGHNGVVGINFMEKLQMPNLPAFYGAILAGVDYVLMGAGIPIQVPGLLDKLAKHEDVTLRVPVEGASQDDDYRIGLDPRKIIKTILQEMQRPKFFAIVSSHTLASMLAVKSTGYVDGFIVEAPTAGGHNAPPRGGVELNDRGEPIYGQRDLVDFGKMKELGRPFYLAGSYSTHEKLQEALGVGACGVQVGTAFALTDESGLAPYLKTQILGKVADGTLGIFTDPQASPTGFPFKVTELEDTLSVKDVYEERPRTCDLGYLRKIYKKPDGTVGYRCASEPIAAFIAKGGSVEDTVGRKCLCNALVSNADLAQKQVTGYLEQPLVTLGDDLTLVKRIIDSGKKTYTAIDVIDKLLGKT